MYRRGKRGIIQIRVAGVRQSSGTADWQRAKRKETELNAQAYDRAQGWTSHTWVSACNQWFRDHPKLGARLSNKRFAAFWKPHLVGKHLKDITPELVHQAIITRKGVDVERRVKANSTANQYVHFVSRVIRHASDLHPRFQHYPPILSNDRWAPPEEWLAISQYLAPDERDALTFVLATGLREANVMFYEWGWDHGTWGTVPAEDTKTDKPYGIPFNLTAQAILARRKAATVRHVRYAFCQDDGRAWTPLALLRPLARACKKAGVEKLTVRQLRHTFATWLARSGVAREIRQRLMGHSTREVHDRYTHYDVESLRPYAEVIDRMLAGTNSSQATG